jgi:large subunit ribosomal protein L25
MPTHPQLKAEPRELHGKKVGRLRRQGMLPATVYGPTTEPQAIQLNAHDFGLMLRRAGRTQLIDLVIGEQAPRPVLVRQAQVEPKRNLIQHVEFFQPNLRQPITTHLPVHLVGESPAVREGGILLQLLDHVDVESLPDDVPANGLEVDVSAIEEINGVIHISDLQAPAGLTILTPGDEMVVKVNPPEAAEVVEEAIADTEPLPNELGGDQPQADAVPEA